MTKREFAERVVELCTGVSEFISYNAANGADEITAEDIAGICDTLKQARKVAKDWKAATEGGEG